MISELDQLTPMSYFQHYQQIVAAKINRSVSRGQTTLQLLQRPPRRHL